MWLCNLGLSCNSSYPLTSNQLSTPLENFSDIPFTSLPYHTIYAFILMPILDLALLFISLIKVYAYPRQQFLGISVVYYLAYSLQPKGICSICILCPELTYTLQIAFLLLVSYINNLSLTQNTIIVKYFFKRIIIAFISCGWPYELLCEIMHNINNQQTNCSLHLIYKYFSSFLIICIDNFINLWIQLGECNFMEDTIKM